MHGREAAINRRFTRAGSLVVLLKTENRHRDPGKIPGRRGDFSSTSISRYL
jgi:hypothetical protein